MSARVRSISRGRRDKKESSNQFKPVIHNSDKSKQKQPPTEHQDIETREDEEGMVVVEIEEEETELEVDCLEMDIKMSEDGPDVKEKILPNLENAKIPEAGGDMQP